MVMEMIRLQALRIIVLAFIVSSVMGYSEKLLLVSMDGFRWDYLDGRHGVLPNFDRMAKMGSIAPYLMNTYATMTFPTHYSIATGLYQESHGIIGNAMYDPVWQERFWQGNTDSKWWNAGEPVWITATKNGKKSGCVYFPGSEVEIHGVRPDFWLKFNYTAPFDARVDQVIKWYVEEDLDLGVLYFNEPDSTGHTYGPLSPEVTAKVQEMDSVLGYLLDSLEKYELKDSVNVILTADHGMTDIPPDQIVDIYTYINEAQLEAFVDLGAQCHLFPIAGEEQAVYNALHGKHPHMDVYWKEDILPEWNYKNNRRVPPILISMDVGWTCTNNLDNPWLIQKGNHGYDNGIADMRPIFLAYGPDIKQDYRAVPFESVDIYPLVCEMLQIPPAPNNGSLSSIGHIVRTESASLRLVGNEATYMALHCIWMVLQVGFILL